jgi:hypothetical protein
LTTTGRQELDLAVAAADARCCLLDLYKSAVGRLEQLADVGWRDTALRGLNNYATFLERADASVR